MAKKKLSVAEILAAARKQDGKNGEDAEADDTASAQSQQPAPDADALQSEPDAPKASEPKPAGKSSVSDILAMARAGGKGGAKPADKPKSTPTQKPAAGKPAANPVSGKTGPKDTASILTAARKGVKPGPMTKSEAAVQGGPAQAKGGPAQRTAPPMPEKPAYAKPSPKTGKKAGAETDRRSVFSLMLGSFLGVGFTATGLTSGLWTLGLARFMFPNILTEPPSKFRVGAPAEFAPGQVQTKFKAQYGVWIVNGQYNGQSQLYALRTVCTHLGCTPNWLEGEQKFKCPCHGSGFYADGINFEGPAPRPLERYAVSIANDGQLMVDKSKKFQEELGQWADPESYVPV